MQWFGIQTGRSASVCAERTIKTWFRTGPGSFSGLSQDFPCIWGSCGLEQLLLGCSRGHVTVLGCTAQSSASSLTRCPSAVGPHSWRSFLSYQTWNKWESPAGWLLLTFHSCFSFFQGPSRAHTEVIQSSDCKSQGTSDTWGNNSFASVCVLGLGMDWGRERIVLFYTWKHCLAVCCTWNTLQEKHIVPML